MSKIFLQYDIYAATEGLLTSRQTYHSPYLIQVIVEL